MTGSRFKWPASTPSVVEFAVLDLILVGTYTLIILVGMAFADNLFGRLVSSWVELMDAPVSSVLIFLPAENSSVTRGIADGLKIYRHSVVMSSLITIACIDLSKKYWSAWSRDFLQRLRSKQTPAIEYSVRVRATYRYSIMGIIATIFLLLLAEPRDAATMNILYGHRWTMLRSPLLLSLACFFACHVLMLRRLLPSDEAD